MQANLIPVLFGQKLDSDVSAWLIRVAAAGGSVSPSTKKAVNTFVTQAKAASLWGLFRRLNLVCGDFPASFIPLVNTSGSAADTNSNLLTTDYTEALGWQTDGSTKNVDTGYTPSEATGDLSVYLRTTQTSNTTPRFLAGSSGVGATQAFALRGNRDATNVATSGAVSGIWGGATASINPATTGGAVAGMWQITRRGSTDAELYLNGATKGTAATPTTPATSGFSIILFGANTGAFSAPLESGSRIAGYSVSTGMTTAQTLAYYTVMQTFQTALNRQV